MSLDEKVAESNRIIETALKMFKNPAVAFSGGSDSLTLLNLVLPFKKDIPVIFIDTRDEFPETKAFVEECIDYYHLKAFKAISDENRHGEFRSKNDTSVPAERAKFTAECCGYHKIRPFVDKIKELKLDSVFVGIRASEHEERKKAGIFEPKVNLGYNHFRVHPLMNWTIEDVMTFLRMNNIKCNPLYSQGYASLGCRFCTKKSPELVERGGRDKIRDSIMPELRKMGYT